jgi:hypothetical protein
MNPLSSLYYDPFTCEISYYTPRWYDLSGQRSIAINPDGTGGDISYLNNTGRPITVNINSNFNNSTNTYYRFIVVSGPNSIECARIHAVTPNLSSISVVVPADSFYYLERLAGTEILIIKSWCELR